jgi:uncharacterized protein YneF (UPF0154 family)
MVGMQGIAGLMFMLPFIGFVALVVNLIGGIFRFNRFLRRSTDDAPHISL